MNKCVGGQVAEVVLELLEQADKVGVGANVEFVKEGLNLIVGRFAQSGNWGGVFLIHGFEASGKQDFRRVVYSAGRRLARTITGGRAGGFNICRGGKG